MCSEAYHINIKHVMKFMYFCMFTYVICCAQHSKFAGPTAQGVLDLGKGGFTCPFILHWRAHPIQCCEVVEFNVLRQVVKVVCFFFVRSVSSFLCCFSNMNNGVYFSLFLAHCLKLFEKLPPRPLLRYFWHTFGSIWG